MPATREKRDLRSYANVALNGEGRPNDDNDQNADYPDYLGNTMGTTFGDRCPVQKCRPEDGQKWWHVADDKLQTLVNEITEGKVHLAKAPVVEPRYKPMAWNRFFCDEKLTGPSELAQRKANAELQRLANNRSHAVTKVRKDGDESEDDEESEEDEDDEDDEGVDLEDAGWRGKRGATTLVPDQIWNSVKFGTQSDNDSPMPKKRIQKAIPKARPDSRLKGERRSDKWWHVSDAMIENHNEERAKSRAKEFARTGKSMILSMAGKPDAASLGELPTCRKQINVRLYALRRSDTIPCPQTGRRHAALPKHDNFITVYFHMLDTQTQFKLHVDPDLRIGPEAPPVANRFTDKFGLAASTKGFADKSQTFDYQLRQWQTVPLAKLVPSWTESLKSQIERASGIPVARQRLVFDRCVMRDDSRTVRSCGIISGNQLQVSDTKKEKKDQSTIVLACSAKRLEIEDARARLEESRLKVAQRVAADEKANQANVGKQPCVMPPWKTTEAPGLFGSMANNGGKFPNSQVPIHYNHGEDPAVHRVRSLPCFAARATNK